MDTFETVRFCALALLAGTVLQTSGVSAGNGIIVDWRSVKSGETIQEGGDAFDTAQLFVALVGDEAALACVIGDTSPAEAFVAPPLPVVEVVEYCRNASGARRRAFTAGPFRVIVEPCDDDDAAQAAFTRRLADFAAVRS